MSAEGVAVDPVGRFRGMPPESDVCPHCHQRMPTEDATDGPSLLRAWIRDTGRTQRDFAADLGVTESALCKILTSVNAPGTTVALAVECLTDGRVPRTSWPKITARSRVAP